MININIEKARDIHRDNIRRIRALELAALDTAYMKALESGDTAKQEEVRQKKQVLRDLPSCSGICTATTCEELCNHWPDELLGNRPNPYVYSMRECRLNELNSDRVGIAST